MVGYSQIGLDTNVQIYYIEEHPVFLKKVEPIIDRIAGGKATGITSYVTLLELLVKPIKEKRLRAKYGIKTPDAIQLASVISKNGEVFITNDERLDAVKEIKVLTLSRNSAKSK